MQLQNELQQILNTRAMVVPFSLRFSSIKGHVLSKHWKITQVKLCCACWTADSQANVGKHQLYNNQKKA